MSILNNQRVIFCIFFFIYLIANSFFILNYNGVYWDDWTLYEHDFETINSFFYQAAGEIGYSVSWLHYALSTIGNGVYIYRVFTFFLLFMSCLFLYNIFCSIKSISDKDRFFLVLFVLLAPLYGAKVALIDFPYTLYSTLFFFPFFCFQNILVTWLL